MINMQIIQNADLKNKNVLLRLELNVPIEDGKILNDKRVREALPTIKFLIENGVAKITIIAHLGKPEGKVDKKYSLWPVANRLSELLSSGKNYISSADEYPISDKILLLENLRFNPGEEENDSVFAKNLTKNQDIFINDAFGTCHRAHASTVGVTKFLPSYAGLLIQKEVENLTKLETAKEKSFTVILGGAKIADKLPIIKNLTSRAQNFLIGGAIASTFLVARRHYLGKSLIENDDFREANIIWQQIMDEPDRNIYLPVDLVISRSLEKAVDQKEIDVSVLLKPDAIEEYMVVDIGSKTREKYAKVIEQSKTIFWNGNMGVSEVEEFSKGTEAIADAVASSPAFSVVGGGDTVGFLENAGLIDKVSFASTGGGATLEFISGQELPGLKVLE